MRRVRAGTLALLLCLNAQAAPTAKAVRAEIDGLLGQLSASGCQFNRNGTWHSADEARTHLLRKLSALEDRGRVDSTEQFIALAASKSSTSGEPYQVRCGAAKPTPSADWLTQQLQRLRSK